MDYKNLTFSLVPAPSDPEIESAEIQNAFRSFEHVLGTKGVKVSAHVIIRKAIGSASSYLGDFVIPLAQVVGPTLGVVFVAWIQGRSGRKVRVKIGDVEVEAGTAKEVEELFEKAQQLRKGAQDGGASNP